MSAKEKGAKAPAKVAVKTDMATVTLAGHLKALLARVAELERDRDQAAGLAGMMCAALAHLAPVVDELQRTMPSNIDEHCQHFLAAVAEIRGKLETGA